MYRTIQARLRSNKKSMRRKSWEWVFFLISLSAKLPVVATELVGLQPLNYGFLEENSPPPKKNLFALPFLSQRCQNEVGCKKCSGLGQPRHYVTNLPKYSHSSFVFRLPGNSDLEIMCYLREGGVSGRIRNFVRWRYYFFLFWGDGSGWWVGAFLLVLPPVATPAFPNSAALDLLQIAKRGGGGGKERTTAFRSLVSRIAVADATNLCVLHYTGQECEAKWKFKMEVLQ